MIGHHDHLLGISQVDASDRAGQRQRLTQPGQPGVAVAITPGNTTTVNMDVLLFLRVGSEP
jgi:hypothetical protein